LNGECVLLYSVATGTNPGSCGRVIAGAWEYNEILCESHACVPVDILTNQYVCTDGWKTKTQNTCTNNSDCSGMSTYNGTTYVWDRSYSCRCGTNTDGAAYCRQHTGDAIFANVKKYTTMKYGSPKFLTSCNTAARHSHNCTVRVLSNDDFNAYETALLYYADYHNIKAGQDCMLYVYESKYEYYRENPDPVDPVKPDYDDDVDDNDFAGLIGIIGLLVLT